jgi:hypothetical protein
MNKPTVALLTAVVTTLVVLAVYQPKQEVKVRDLTAEENLAIDQCLYEIRDAVEVGGNAPYTMFVQDDEGVRTDYFTATPTGIYVYETKVDLSPEETTAIYNVVKDWFLTATRLRDGNDTVLNLSK